MNEDKIVNKDTDTGIGTGTGTDTDMATHDLTDAE
jgi:hypothetical protein